MIQNLGDMPVIALTATATPKVQLDIQKNLQMEEADVFISSFNRKNLYYEVRPKKETKKQLIGFLKNNKGKSGIIYCLSRKKVEEIAQLLNVNGFKAAPYHAGLDPDVLILPLELCEHWGVTVLARHLPPQSDPLTRCHGDIAARTDRFAESALDAL